MWTRLWVPRAARRVGQPACAISCAAQMDVFGSIVCVIYPCGPIIRARQLFDIGDKMDGLQVDCPVKNVMLVTVRTRPVAEDRVHYLGTTFSLIVPEVTAAENSGLFWGFNFSTQRNRCATGGGEAVLVCDAPQPPPRPQVLRDSGAMAPTAPKFFCACFPLIKPSMF